MIKSSKTYDRLKFIAQIGLPALATLYFTLALLWGDHADERVLGTIAAVDTLLGSLLGLSSSAYANSDDRFDGVLVNHGEGVFSMETELTGNAVEDKREVVLRVGDPPPVPETADEVVERVVGRKKKAKVKPKPRPR